MSYIPDSLPPGVTYTPTGLYSGDYASTDPERRFVFNHDLDYPAIVPADQATWKLPVTFAEAQAEAVEHFEDLIKDLQGSLDHVRQQTTEDFAK